MERANADYAAGFMDTVHEAVKTNPAALASIIQELVNENDTLMAGINNLQRSLRIKAMALEDMRKRLAEVRSGE